MTEAPTTENTVEVKVGKLIFNPANPNETMTIVEPQSWDLVYRDMFVAEYEYTGLRMYFRFTGRTRQKWGKACPTVERYYIDTVVVENFNGTGLSSIVGVPGRRIAGTWATRPENVTEVVK
jgi:hypothetical protein